MRHLMSPLDFSVEELDKLLTLANDIEKHPDKYARRKAACHFVLRTQYPDASQLRGRYDESGRQGAWILHC